MENNNFVEDRISDNLVFFGASHTQNLVEISKLIEAIRNFNPSIILIEGGFEKATFKSEEQAIKTGGEMGAVSFFAKTKGIILLPNDPDRKDELEFMTEKFGKDFTNLYFSLRESKEHPDYFNPTLSINEFNTATRELNKFRDAFMINKIRLLIKENKKICVVKGSHHLLMNKDKIRKIIR